MKILISVYACQPDRGSEPGVGWNFVQEMACWHDVWAITRSANARIIESFIQKKTISNIHWIYYDLPAWVPFSNRLDKLEFVYYLFWQFSILRVAKRWHKQIEFDLVHHVTFVTYWIPSLLALLPIPFIWGPVGGGEEIPSQFLSTLGFHGRLYEYARSIIHRLGELNPFVRLTARRAKMILATSHETKRCINRIVRSECIIFSQVGISDEDFKKLSSSPFKNETPFRVISAGVLNHYKGYHLSISAFAVFHNTNPNSQYWIFGDGPERKSLTNQCKKLGIEKDVIFYGQVPRNYFLENLAYGDVFLHPSLHESGGLVIVEALSAGRPVICLDLGGPGLQVNKNNGYKIIADSPQVVEGAISDALTQLARDTELRKKLYKNAISGVAENYLWKKKGAFISDLYQQVTQINISKKVDR